MPLGSRAGDAGGRNHRVDFGPPTAASGSNGNKSDGSRTTKKLGAVAKAVAATVVAERQVVARTSLMDVKSGKDVSISNASSCFRVHEASVGNIFCQKRFGEYVIKTITSIFV